MSDPTNREEVPGTPGEGAPPSSDEHAGGESLAAVTSERDRLKESLLRSLADLDNYRKRARREQDEAARKAREDTLRELLPVFDNLERASRYLDTGADLQAISKGIEMVLKLFEDTLSRIGGRRVPALGLPFDPSVHEAIQQIESAEHPAGTVAREELAGYVLNDRLLRPAMVVVSKGAPKGGAGAADPAGA